MDSRAKNAPFPVYYLATGSGKSTLINYLMGVNMVIKKYMEGHTLMLLEGNLNPKY